MSDQVLVMNQGRIEEIADADTLYANPQKEYTKMLIEAILREAKISLTDAKTGHGKSSPSKCSILPSLKTRIKVSKILGQTLM
jgi:ABC-type oligopeptide transport system ATPase subunit